MKLLNSVGKWKKIRDSKGKKGQLRKNNLLPHKNFWASSALLTGRSGALSNRPKWCTFKPAFTMQLYQSQCPLQVILPSGMGHLAIINRLAKGWFNRFFYIEIDDKTADVLKPEVPLALCFEFWDQDNIRHIFKAHGVTLEKQLLKVKYPEGIERCQQRQFYRVKVPEKTSLTFFLKARKHVSRLRDISLGGSFGTITIEGQRKSANSPKLKINDELTNLRLEATLFRRDFMIYIAKARVVRVLPQGLNKFGFGLEFVTLEPDQKTILSCFVRENERHNLCCRTVLNNDEYSNL